MLERTDDRIIETGRGQIATANVDPADTPNREGFGPGANTGR